MRKKQLIIIRDQLEPVMPLLKKLQNRFPGTLYFLEYRQFCNDEGLPRFQSPVDLLVLCSENIFQEREHEIHTRLAILFRRYQPCLVRLQLARTSDFSLELSYAHQNPYPLLPGAAEEVQASGLGRYLLQTAYTAELKACLAGIYKADSRTGSFKAGDEEPENQTDHLTSLYNRNTFYGILRSRIRGAGRDTWRLQENRAYPGKQEAGAGFHKPKGRLTEHFGRIALMLIDIDHFAQINETHGHPVGDLVLQTFSRMLVDPEIFRSDDIAGRFGGEAFTILLAHTNSRNARIPARRLMGKLAECWFTGKNNAQFKLTISIGISEYHKQDSLELDLLQRAEQALGKAKELGRNRIIVYENHFSADRPGDGPLPA